jgi:NADPH-dependent curcumin reductase
VPESNRQIVLASRPSGSVRETDFRLVETDVPEIGEGQFLVRNRYLSLDPYMRRRMDEGKSYARKVEIGEVMVGGTVGEVVASRHPDFQTGDTVLGSFGWQLYGVGEGRGERKIEEAGVPASAYLGVLGMPGVTAYVGLLDIGEPKPGETVVVSAASGAVGSVVGQLAKIKGCRAVGIAGGPEKSSYVVDELGFDACIDYKAGRLKEDLARETPDGIDIYFDNVGGEILDTVLRRLNPFSRIPLCGVISQYDTAEPYGVRNYTSLLVNRVRLQGFIVSDHLSRWPAALEELGGYVRDGRLRYRESVVEGLENAPAAFLGLLTGRNFGKQLVRLG